MRTNAKKLWLALVCAVLGSNCMFEQEPWYGGHMPPASETGAVQQDAGAVSDSAVQTDSRVADAGTDSGASDATDANVTDVPRRRARIQVRMAATPTSSTTVKHGQNVPSLGVTYVCDPLEDVTLVSLTHTGAGDINGAFLRANFDDVGTMCTLVQTFPLAGPTYFARGAAPNAAGRFTLIPSVPLTCVRGTTRTFTVLCNRTDRGDPVQRKPLRHRPRAGRRGRPRQHGRRGRS
jgi:hypothetical protein